MDPARLFLGVELSLSAMTAAMVFIFDLAVSLNGGAQSEDSKLAATGGFLALSFFLLLWVMSTHQDWEPRNDAPRKQIAWLGVFSNAIGASLLVTFVLLIKGVSN